MGIKLEELEARLQALIESSVVLFARGNSQRMLAHQLIEAAQANIIVEQDNRAVAPHIYTIHLHPESLHYWQQHQELLESVGHHLVEAALEFGVTFLSQPVLRLIPDESLPLEGIRVDAKEEQDSSGHTAAFSFEPAISQQNAVPLNAYFIIEGDRIFPLTRAVINIGRRPDNHLVLNDPRVSRSHAQLRAIRGQYVLFDLNSTGGTLVNGRRINQCTLQPGDVVSLSGVPLIYGEEMASSDENTTEHGFTRSINTPAKNEPPELFE